MTRLPHAAWFIAATTLVSLAPLTRAIAQNTPPEAVVIGLRYDPNTKPGVIVLRVAGSSGDSIRAIFQNDFNNGDRINVIAGDESGLPDTPTAGRNGNYPLFARLGAL